MGIKRFLAICVFALNFIQGFGQMEPIRSNYDKTDKTLHVEIICLYQKNKPNSVAQIDYVEKVLRSTSKCLTKEIWRENGELCYTYRINDSEILTYSIVVDFETEGAVLAFNLYNISERHLKENESKVLTILDDFRHLLKLKIYVP